EARASAVGFDGFLVKPIAPSELVEAVRARLPLAEARAASRGQGRHVLVADDDAVHLALLRTRLGSLGFRVTAAAGGAEALEEIRRSPPDAVVCDTLMPGLDGFGLCLAMRKDARLADVPVVLVSPVVVEDADRLLAHNVGASAIVMSAGDRSELVGALLESLRSGSVPRPSGSLDLLEEERAHRVIRQLERQVAASAGLAQRCTLQAAELAILAGITEALARAEDVDRVMTEVLARCLDAGEMSAGAVLLAAEGGPAVVRAQSGIPSARSAGLATLFGNAGVLARALAGEALALPGSAPAAVAGEVLRALDASSALLVPIAWREAPLGALLVCSRGRSLGDPEAIRFVRTVAGQVGQAIALARAFADAQQAIRVRDDFLSVASHELKTPITSLQLGLQSLIRQVDRDPPGRPVEGVGERLRAVDRQVQRLTRLVDELLEISRLQSGAVNLDPEPLDLAAVVREVVARFEHDIARSRSPVAVSAEGAVAGRWDRLRVEQVVTNLLSNALRYGEGKPIALRLEDGGASVRIIVRDQGIGVSPEDQARIFERFERAVSLRHYGGFGLGLWIVRQIVDAMGGTVTLASVQGEGSTFTVELPREPRAAVARPPA
ncbi:MAG TPA: ATP-binding protein, partial [Planctomycetota bacterium]|nr:ATP-binding protein [Planctomycetota bacterium]